MIVCSWGSMPWRRVKRGDTARSAWSSIISKGIPVAGIRESPTKKNLTAKDAKAQRKTRMSYWSDRPVRSQKHLTAEVAEITQRSQRKPTGILDVVGLQKSRDHSLLVPAKT